ncbi:hypothetical protein [Nocardioides guangzhouensis]|uniref:hypothetical protein n=1 Tax=Nocardioides guangzhouensis TaxID=2497878 RepID=UPI0014384506|nr:hypothetical protein [Nocardioides guangzhouensis]
MEHIDPSEIELDRRLEQISKRSKGLTDLMTQRQDLHGVSARADYLAESVSWSV